MLNFVKVTKGYLSGKYYYEAKIEQFDLTAGVSAVMISNIDYTSYIGYYMSNSESGISINGDLSVLLDPYIVNDILGIALDIDNKKISFYKNSILMATVDIHFEGEIYASIASEKYGSISADYNFGEKEFSIFNTPLFNQLLRDGFIPYDLKYSRWMYPELINLIVSNVGYSSGKYYYETVITKVTSGFVSYICDSSHDISSKLNSIGYYVDNKYSGIYINGALKTPTESCVVNDIIGTAIDLDNRVIKIYKNRMLIYSENIPFIGQTFIGVATKKYVEFDITSNFGTNVFDLWGNNEWDDLVKDGYLPYDYPNALWTSSRENNPYGLYFNGINSGISVPSNALQKPTTAVTIDTYVTIEDFPETGQRKILDYNTNGHIYLAVDSNKNMVFGVMRGTDTVYSTISYLIPDNLIQTITHVACSYDGQFSRLFINGIQIFEEDWGNVKAIKAGTNTVLSIGKNPTTATEFFKGNIDEVRLWSKALSEGEINYFKDRKLLGTESNLIGYYTFDEGTGTIATDMSESKLNGTITTPLWIPGEVDLITPPTVDIIHVSESSPWITEDGVINFKYTTTLDTSYTCKVEVNGEERMVFDKPEGTSLIEFILDKNIFKLGSNIIKLIVSNSYYNLNHEYEIVKENRDTFTFKRNFNFEEDKYAKSPNLQIKKDEGISLTSIGSGTLDISIPTDGKSKISNIFTGIEFKKVPIVPTMTSNSMNGYIASASSIYSVTYDAWKAFNGLTSVDGDSWASGNVAFVPQWLKIKLPIPKMIIEYSLTGPFSPTESLKSWRLEGSNNDIDWITLDTQINAPVQIQSQEISYNINSPGLYEYYRLYVTEKHGSTNYVRVGEFQLYEYSASQVGNDLIQINNPMIYNSDIDNGKIYEHPIDLRYNKVISVDRYVKYASDTQDAYLGKVNNIITGNNLYSLLGLTVGTSVVTDDITWLKFISKDGKEILIADRNIKHSISYSQLESVGIVKTIPSGYYPEQQGKIITIGGKQYKCRLLTGGNANPASSGAGSEWDRFIVGLVPSNNDSNWNNIYSWCQEVHSSFASYRVIRGSSAVSSFSRTTSTGTSSNFGVRPVLEEL